MISEYHKTDTLVYVLSTAFLRSVQRRGIHRGIYLPSTAINFLIKLRASERVAGAFFAAKRRDGKLISVAAPVTLFF